MVASWLLDLAGIDEPTLEAQAGAYVLADALVALPQLAPDIARLIAAAMGVKPR